MCWLLLSLCFLGDILPASAVEINSLSDCLNIQKHRESFCWISFLDSLLPQLKFIPLGDSDASVPVTLNVTNVAFLNALTSGDGISLEISTKVSYTNKHVVNSPSFQNVSTFFKNKKWMDGLVFKWHHDKVKEFWYPPIEFQHILESTVDTDATKIKMDLGNGDVTIYKKYNVVLQCALNLKDYPFDKSLCKMNLRKIENLPIDISLTMAPILDQLSTSNYLVEPAMVRPSETDELGHLSLMVSRKTEKFLVKSFGISGLLVMIAWLIILVDHNVPSVRITPLITLLLTLVNMLNTTTPEQNSADGPTVLEQWYIWNIIFVIAILFQYGVILIIKNMWKSATSSRCCRKGQKIEVMSQGDRKKSEEQLNEVCNMIDNVTFLLLPLVYTAMLIYYGVTYGL